MNNISEQEKGVLQEYVEYARSTSAIINASSMHNRLMFNFENGEGASVELLNKHFYELIKEESLSKREIRKLAKQISYREFKWILADEDYELDFDDVIHDGFGQVTISDGTKIDFPPDLYKEERERYNQIQKERLERIPTNGLEYLE